MYFPWGHAMQWVMPEEGAYRPIVQFSQVKWSRLYVPVKRKPGLTWGLSD